jgi:DNA-binding NarL/FixJ family response regulator
MNKGKRKIFIVDDHPIVRHGLRQLIELENDLVISGEAATANEAIEKIARDKPDLVLIDLSLNDDMSGIDLIKAIGERHRTVKTMVISMFEESYYIERALRAGARGYIPKKYAYAAIIEAIRKVFDGEIYLSDNASRDIIGKMFQKQGDPGSSPTDVLSDREFAVFRMIGQGHETASIAEKLGLSKNTVQTYKRQIKEKLGIDNHVDLIRRATLFVQSEME